MAFGDLNFIFIFLPVFVLLYISVPQKYRTALLLVGSMAFYFIGSRFALPDCIIMPATLVFTYISSVAIKKNPEKSRGISIAAIVILCASLCYYKYFAPSLPLGMSFFTFISIAYIVDIKRGVKPARSLVQFGAYYAMFPKVISGPLTVWDDTRDQMTSARPSLSDFAEGMRLFITGLASKAILADTIGRLWKQVTFVGLDSISTPLAWLGAAAFSFRIYFDFHGYSLMAQGIGRMLGYSLPRNFDYPYMSLSMTEFWRRWHITLGRWFRDYVYIPCGGSRCGKAKLMRNLLIVWALTGIWHGSTVNFLLWGLCLFAVIAMEKLWLKKYLDRYPALGHIYMILLIPISWMLFANTDFSSLSAIFSRMFVYHGGAADTVRYLRAFAFSLPACLICCTPLPAKLFSPIRTRAAGMIVYAILFAASIYCICQGAGDPFMYFSF